MDESHRRDWKYGSTWGTAAHESSHGLAVYEKLLGFDRRELEGLTVLDLGSGATEKFSRELAAAGITAKVISMNPDYAISEEMRETIQNKPDWQEKSVSGLAQDLPFADASFDRIYGLNSVTLYEKPGFRQENTKRWLQEIVRVLKPGGEAVVGPIDFISYDKLPGEYPPEYQSLIDELLKEGIEVQTEPVVYNEHEYFSSRLKIRKPKISERD